MFFENYHITYSNKLLIHSISSYKNIMNKFVIKFISKKKNNYENLNDLFSDALIYSKYYLYWKIYMCTYSNDIMEILYFIDNPI